MEIMYLRHGREQLDAKMEEVFGTSDLNSGLSLGLSAFMSCLHAEARRRLAAAAAKGGLWRPSATAR